MQRKQITLSNIFYFFQGNIRYKLYYSNYVWLIPQHILEQIHIRINSMDRECYSNGQCKLCGCETTALQMCDKACDKPCYPKMMSKKEWENFLNNKGNDDWFIINGKFVKK